jgi:release factor glutamine methyltransferase
MKYREILLAGEEKLASQNIADSKNDAWLLFEHIFKMPRHKYFINSNDECVDEKLYKDYLDAIEIRANHIPLQHITKTQDFMGMTFNVNENVLIPRQDTEVLVEKALSVMKDGDKVLDMCTGSGCIAISIAKLKNVDVTAVDISPKALEVARENAKNLGASNVTFIESNLFKKIYEDSTSKNCNKYNIIVSNPPYIKSLDIEDLMVEVKEHEPRLALDGDEDGLKFYRAITRASLDFLKSGGYLIYEIGCDQGEDLRNIMVENGFIDIEIIKDLAGLDRVCIGIKN